MNQPKSRQVLDCASPLALFDLIWKRKSGRGLPQSKTLSRRRTDLRHSWSERMRKNERGLSMNLEWSFTWRQGEDGHRAKSLTEPVSTSETDPRLC